jgi:hypothetical protein
MKPDGSVPCSQQPATVPYPQPTESNPHYFSNIYFNIILRPRLRTPSGLLLSDVPTKFFILLQSLPTRATCPTHLILFDFITLITYGEG